MFHIITKSRSRHRKLVAVLVVFALVLTAAWVSERPAVAQEDGSFNLTILHNNDGESKLLPDETEEGEGPGFPGIARFVTSLKGLQAEATERGSQVITLTSGDNFLASQELAVSLEREGALYDSIALSGLYDAMALGNHDFDLGPDVTARFITGFDPAVPFLSANIDVSDEPALADLDETRLAASTVLQAGDERVGVIGAVTPQLPNISSPRNVVVNPVLQAVTSEVERLTSDGVNKIILVSHLQGVDEELELVGSLSNVDVVIAGGGDNLLANEGDSCVSALNRNLSMDADPVPIEHPYPILRADAEGTMVPVITAPGGYRCIGELNLTFNTDGQITAHTGRSVGVGFDVTPDEGVQSSVVVPLTEAVAAVDTNVIGTSEVALDGRRSMVRTTATNQGNLHADALRAVATNLAEQFGTPEPHIAIQNGGGIRNDAIIPAGDITLGDTWDIAPFNNVVVVGEVPRETLHVLFEQAVDRIPGAGGQFPQVSGLTLTYDPAQPAREINRDGDCSVTGNEGSRVRDIVLDDGTVIVRDGQVVPGDPVVLSIADFLANGGDCYPLGDIDFTNLGTTYQLALADYISQDLNGVITAEQYPEGGEGRIVALEATTEPEPEPEPESSDTYTVKAGDTLRRIAMSLLGDELRWPEIFELNRGKAQSYGGSLTNADLIRIGWVLEIPA